MESESSPVLRRQIAGSHLFQTQWDDDDDDDDVLQRCIREGQKSFRQFVDTFIAELILSCV